MPYLRSLCRRAPHLVAAACIVAAAGTGVVGLHLSVRAVEREYVHSLAPVEVHVKPFGLSLNEEAFRHDDLLPAFGASELLFPSPHDAYEIFKYYQSGFQVYSVATPGTTPIIVLQRIAALGPSLRGRKVVITLTPPTFFRPPLDQESYVANYSTIHATALTFDLSIPYDLRQAVARRLLQYPATLQDNPPLRWALEALASRSWTGRIAYALVYPLGKLCEGVLRLQDEWLTLTATEKPGTPSPAHAELSRPIDWDLLTRQAAAASQLSSRNNPYGFDGSYWREHTHAKVRSEGDPGLVVKWMAAGLRREYHAQEWEDLDLMLRVLLSLGAQPLILSEPFPGRYLDTWGVTPADRAWYYGQIRQLAARRGVALVDFEEHDEDQTFNQDPNGHLSDTGWVLMAHAFDDFYHGVRRPANARPVATSGTSSTVP